MVLSAPPKREGATEIRRNAPPDDSLGFVSVAAEGIDVEIIAPDGTRTSTLADAPTSRIPNSESEVDCHGAPEPGGRESACTASVRVKTPRAGDYTVVARGGTSSRAVILSVGWGTVSQIQRGAFDVPVQVARGGATSFSIIVTRDNVSQRSQPRAGAP
jgi:hypothetical protein